MHFRILLVLLSFTICGQSFALESLTIREAMNKAARQQTLTQKIAKVYLALNDNLYEPRFYQERDAAIELFQKQLDELKWYTPTDKIKVSLKYVRDLWKDYKAIADWSINKEGSVKLLKMCDEMLYASNQLLLAYEDFARELNDDAYNNVFEIIQLMKKTGEKRMLTQRIMLFYLAIKQDIDGPTSKRKFHASIEDYLEVLDILNQATVNSEPIKEELETTQRDWKNLSKLLETFESDPGHISKMMLLTDKLSVNADRMSLLYEDLGVKLSISKSINVAAYQNMLTQRIAKSYVAMAYGYAPAKHKRELITCIDLFEDQMKSMIRSASTEDIKAAVGVVQTMWKNYRILVTKWDKMDELSVTKVLEKGHIMMATCDRVAQEIQNYAQTIPDYKSFFIKDNGETVDDDSNIAHQVHLAGLQRMYSQRIAIYFIMNALKVDTRISQERMSACISNYKKNFEQMMTSKINTPEIASNLTESQQTWDMIEDQCSKADKGNINTVLTQSATLFDKLDALNLLYEKHMDTLFMEK